MTLSSNLIAFLLMFMVAMALILPLTALISWILPEVAIYTQALALPTIVYTTKVLLDWNTREL